MKRILTESGFAAELDETRLNDMELFDGLMALESGDMTALPVVVSKIMGDAKRALYDHVRAENGTVPMERVMAELQEIIGILGEKKS